MTKQQQMTHAPINSVSAFYALGHMLTEAYLYTINRPLQEFSGNKPYLFSVAFDKNTEQIWISSFDAPVSLIENVAQKMTSILTETLDLNMKLTFINIGEISENKLKATNAKLDKMNTSVIFFQDMAQAYNYLSKKNPAHNFPDNETIEACWDYLNTVIKYLNQLN